MDRPLTPRMLAVLRLLDAGWEMHSAIYTTGIGYTLYNPERRSSAQDKTRRPNAGTVNALKARGLLVQTTWNGSPSYAITEVGREALRAHYGPVPEAATVDEARAILGL